MFDKFLENIDDVAAKLGLPADQVQELADSFKTKLGDGTDYMGAMMATMQEHGLSMDSIQGFLGGLGENSSDLMAKASAVLGQGGDGAKDALGGMLDMAKGIFGKE
jgi:hypothetical protein